MAQNRINKIIKQVEIELRIKYGLTNIDYHQPSNMLEMPHIDVYAENPEDAKRQLVKKRGVIREYLGVEVPGSIDALFIMDCTCRGFNKRLKWGDIKGGYVDKGPLVPPGHEKPQKNYA